ncbi:MAG: group III truncated hemoglobin [Sphingobacteriales bacterium]|nr:MAG: group III truncated hemoglobin [Sphingobacteriales bacterium]
MKEIDDRADIQLLVESFYERVKRDELIGHIFNNAHNFSWDTHIPVMVNFWETILLDTGRYHGNPMLTHIELNKREPLLSPHFERWIKLFSEMLDEHFTGSRVEEAKKRADSMALLMQYKIGQSSKPGFIQ